MGSSTESMIDTFLGESDGDMDEAVAAVARPLLKPTDEWYSPFQGSGRQAFGSMAADECDDDKGCDCENCDLKHTCPRSKVKESLIQRLDGFLEEAVRPRGSSLNDLHEAWLDAIFDALSRNPSKYMGKGMAAARGHGNIRLLKAHSKRATAFSVSFAGGSGTLEIAVVGDWVNPRGWSVLYGLYYAARPAFGGGRPQYKEEGPMALTKFTRDDTPMAVAQRARKELDMILKRFGVGLG